MEFRTYFVYFHTFSYKFKVQRTPTEFGLPVFLQEIHKLCTKTLLNLEELLRMQKVARNEKSCSKYENLPSKLVESPISRNWKLRTEATTGLGASVACGGRLFCCWVQGPMLGAATNAGKCLDGDLLLITVRFIYVL